MDRPFSRQRFTQVLTLVCQTLDECHQGMADYHLDYESTTIHGKVSSKVHSVQAFGSWARGALVCGNLDLAVELDHQWVDGPWLGNRQLADHLIDGVQIARSLMGRHPSVRYLPLQAALEGPQAIDPAELKPIWRAPVPGEAPVDWRRAIRSIALDPNAQRFSRSIVSLSGVHDLVSISGRRQTVPDRPRATPRHPERDAPTSRASGPA